MLAIAPTIWKLGESQRFTDTQFAFLYRLLQRKPVSRESLCYCKEKGEKKERKKKTFIIHAPLSKEINYVV